MKETRRVKYTKRLLNESLLKFLEEKPISRVTVRELCADADVNRSTYYNHFSDPYDQLRQLESELLADMAVYVDGIASDYLQKRNTLRSQLPSVLAYIASHKHAFQVLLRSGGDFQRQMLSFFGQRLLQDVPAQQSEALRYRYIFAGTGAFGLVYHWLFCEESMPVETLSAWITQCAAGCLD